MSYEMMWEKIGPCRCGLGTVMFRVETDDWNRTRRSSETCCPACALENAIEQHRYWKAERFRQDCLLKARTLAEERYMQMWLECFRSCTRKAAWLRYTNGKGYPGLETFCKHVRHSGSLTEHMRLEFRAHVERALRQMQIVDEEISALFAAGTRTTDS